MSYDVRPASCSRPLLISRWPLAAAAQVSASVGPQACTTSVPGPYLRIESELEPHRKQKTSSALRYLTQRRVTVGKPRPGEYLVGILPDPPTLFSGA
jgi:hypothetical protein